VHQPGHAPDAKHADTGDARARDATTDARPPGIGRARHRSAGTLGRAEAAALQRTIGNHALAELLRPAEATGGARLQRMSIRGVDTASSVSGTTRTKHVVAAADQAARAAAEFGSTTFVTSEAVLTDAVDADDHDFTEAAAAKSARFDLAATVEVSRYDKTEPPPAGFARGKPVSKTIDDADTACEIGVVKTGADAISITHFKTA
jgi:hypothetical protein